MGQANPVGQQPLFAICYDISDSRERRRADKLLAGFGFRVQKSVYECHLGKSQKQQLLAGLERLALRTGHLRIYRVYAEGAARTVGKAPTLAHERYCFAI